MSIDEHSATWATIKAHAEKEIEAARSRLEIIGPVSDHDMERGAIKALRGILALTTKVAEIAMETGSSDSGY